MNFRSPTQLWAGRALVTLAALAVLVALWPNARSLYDLTGEEQLRGQAAGVVQLPRHHRQRLQPLPPGL